jgi:hypothetical protein
MENLHLTSQQMAIKFRCAFCEFIIIIGKWQWCGGRMNEYVINCAIVE